MNNKLLEQMAARDQLMKTIQVDKQKKITKFNIGVNAGSISFVSWDWLLTCTTEEFVNFLENDNG